MPEEKSRRQRMNNERMAISFTALATAAAALPVPGNGKTSLLLATTLFGAQAIKNTFIGALLPLGGLAAADLVMGRYLTTFWTYLALVLTYTIARWMLRQNACPQRIFAATVLGSLSFFTISNLGLWYEYYLCVGPDYSALQAFTDALKAWGSHLPSDVITTGAVFVLYEATREVQLRKAPATV